MGKEFTDEEIEEMQNEYTDYSGYEGDYTLLYLFLFQVGLLIAMIIFGLCAGK